MLKVLHLLNYPGQGGSEKYILGLMKALQDKCSFYLAHSLDGNLVQAMSNFNVPVRKLPLRGIWDLRAAWQLRKLCREQAIDVLHTHFLRENCIGVMAKLLGARVRLIHTRHMLLANSLPVKLFNRVLSLFVNRYIAVSKAVQEQMLDEGIPGRKISLIYNGVDAAEFSGAADDPCAAGRSSEKGRHPYGSSLSGIDGRPSASDLPGTESHPCVSDRFSEEGRHPYASGLSGADARTCPLGLQKMAGVPDVPGKATYPTSFRADLGIPDNTFVVSCAARFSTEKGHDFLLDVIKLFNELNASNNLELKNKKAVTFLLSGDGELYEAIKLKARQSGLANVIFLGYRQDVPWILKNSDLYVCPSQMEALGISVIEAMAAGLPVIATNVGGLPEILQGSGAGILVDYGDAEAFAQALFKLIYDEDFYQACKNNAVRIVQKRFLLSVMAEKTYQAYTDF
ncbi:MAG: glycosyltransferase [Desulfitobacteriia bacterium]